MKTLRNEYQKFLRSLLFITFVAGMPATSFAGEDIFGSCGQSYERLCLFTDGFLSCDEGFDLDGNELGLTGFHGTELCQPIWEAPPLSGPGGINPFNPDDFTFIVAADVEVSDIPRGGGCAPRSAYGKMTEMTNNAAFKLWPDELDGEGNFAFSKHGFQIGGIHALMMAGDLTHRDRSTGLKYSKERKAFQDYWDQWRFNTDEGPSTIYSVYPGMGNHDYLEPNLCEGTPPSDPNPVPVIDIDGIETEICEIQVNAKNNVMRGYIDERMSTAEGVDYDETSNNYSWDFGDVHFIQGNIWAGKFDNLAWMTADLQNKVGDSGRPVIIIQHYGWDGFSIQERWWTATDRANFEAVIANYNVIGIFTGHTHGAGFISASDVDGPGFDVYTSDDGGSDDQCNKDSSKGAITADADIEGDGGFLVVRVVNDGLGKGKLEVLHLNWNESTPSAADMTHMPVGSNPATTNSPSMGKIIYTGHGAAADLGELKTVKLVELPITDPPFVSLTPTNAPLIEGDLTRVEISDLYTLPNINTPLKKLKWELIPAGLLSQNLSSTVIETDLDPEALSASQDFRLKGAEKWTIRLTAFGDRIENGSAILTELDETEITFSVNNAAPSIDGPANLSLADGDLVEAFGGNYFHSSFKFNDAGGEDDAPFICKVDYGDGTDVEIINSSDGLLKCSIGGLGEEFNPSGQLFHQYAELGLYTVSISVTDKDGATTNHSFEVKNQLDNEPPKVEGGCSNQTINVGEIFGCSPFFTDPDINDIFTVTADYFDGNIETLSVTSGVDENTYVVFIQHTYNDAGTFVVHLRISDGINPPVVQIYTVTVLDVPDPSAPPTLFYKVFGDSLVSGLRFFDLSGAIDEPVSRTFVLKDPDPSHTAWFVAINWNSTPGDNSRAEVDLFHVTRTDGSSDPVEFVATHTYQNAGTFDFKMNAIHDPDKNGLNNEGNTRSELYFFDVNIMDNNQPPTFDSFDITPAVLNEGDTLVRTNLSFSDPDTEDSWLATVNYGDGTVLQTLVLNGKTFSLNHTYLDNADSAYIVTVVVSDGETEPAQISFPVTVNNVSPTGTVSNSGPVNEGSSASVSVSANDPSAVDTAAGFSYSYDFGNTGSFDIIDSLVNTAIVPAQVLDDGPANIPVRIRIADKDGDSSEYITFIEVNNVAPIIASVTGDIIDENDTATVSGSFADASANDSFTVTINWGEGDLAVFSYPAGSIGFTQTHQYLDDNPTGEPSHLYPISVQIVDDDGDAADATTHVTVNNLNPVATVDEVKDAITGLSLSYIDRDGTLVAGDISVLLLGTSIEVKGSYTDIGTLDTHTASIDWDDGTEQPVAISTLGKTDTASHRYALDQAPGDYIIDLTITDDDTGSDTSTATIKIVDAEGALQDAVDDLWELLESGLDQDAQKAINKALKNITGSNGGDADNGALDKLEKGKLNSALNKIKKALKALQKAEAKDATLDLRTVKTQLILTARSVVVTAIEDATAMAIKSKEFRRISAAEVLLSQGDTALATQHYLIALNAYRKAVKKVHKIINNDDEKDDD